MESPSSSALNVSLPQDDEENPSSETPPRAADVTSAVTTAQQQRHDYSGCWITCLICVLVPSIVGLVVLFGLFAVPVIILACFGVSLFCMTPTTTTTSDEAQEEEFKSMTKSEMKSRLIVQHNVREGCCEICLTDFNEDSPETVVVASPNPSCCHVFHQECVLEWLERKPTCPCCRALYLSNVENDEEATNNGDNAVVNNAVVNLEDSDDGDDNDSDEPPEGWEAWINNMMNEWSTTTTATHSLEENADNNEEAQEGCPMEAR
jgi:hypothetical protein